MLLPDVFFPLHCYPLYFRPIGISVIEQNPKVTLLGNMFTIVFLAKVYYFHLIKKNFFVDVNLF